MSLEVPTPLFTILSTLIESRGGLHYGPNEQDLLLERARVRATEVGFESLLDYYYYLRYDPGGPEELERLLESLVVNETYFFRELEALQLVVSTIVPRILESGRRPRIWSAACATGEEPLTLAMLLADDGLLERVELIASDLSQRALERARSGRFGRRSVRDVPLPAVAARWLREDAKGGVRVVSPLIEAVDWRRINLCNPEEVAAVGTCDVILCRNVLIYFSDATAAKVVNTLSGVLAPGALLFVGISESLLRFGTALECEEMKRVFVYRRPQ